MASRTLEIFSNNREKGETTYVVDTFEEAAFRFTPSGDSYHVFIKWKGKDEQDIDRTTKIVFEALLGGDIITKGIYESY